MRNDAEIRVRNSIKQFYGDRYRDERVVVARYNQGSGRNSCSTGRNEVHILVIIGEGPPLLEKCANLLVTMLVTLAQNPPFIVRKGIHCESSHDRPRLFRIVTHCAHQHHSSYPLWLLRSHVQECIATTAHAYCFEVVDA